MSVVMHRVCTKVVVSLDRKFAVRVAFSVVTCVRDGRAINARSSINSNED